MYHITKDGVRTLKLNDYNGVLVKTLQCKIVRNIPSH